VLDACYVTLCIIIFFSSVSNTKFCRFSKIVGYANEVPYNSDFSQCSMQEVPQHMLYLLYAVCPFYSGAFQSFFLL